MFSYITTDWWFCCKIFPGTCVVSSILCSVFLRDNSSFSCCSLKCSLPILKGACEKEGDKTSEQGLM